MHPSISEEEDDEDDEGMTMDYFTMNLLNTSANYPVKEAAAFSARLASTQRTPPRVPTVPSSSYAFNDATMGLSEEDEDEDNEEHEMEIYQNLRAHASESGAEESDDADELDDDSPDFEPPRAAAAPRAGPRAAAPSLSTATSATTTAATAAGGAPYAHLAHLPKIPVTNIAASRVVAKFDPRRVVNAEGGPPDAMLVAHAADGSVRPPYSYTALIYTAMHAIGESHLQLGQIYQQIMASWAYYSDRPNETGWKNSIRHNLTVCRCFKKVARAEGEPGKGGYWAINESFAKIDIVLGPRDNSPRLSRKKLKKKSKSRALAERKDKPLPVNYRLDRRGGVPSPSALAAAEDMASEEEDVVMPSLTMTTRRSTRAAAAADKAPNQEAVYPSHLLSGAFDDACAADPEEFAPQEQNTAGNPFPPIMREDHHSSSVMLGHPGDPIDANFSLSTSFTNGLLGSSLHNSHVLSASFSNILHAAGGLSTTL
jgi:hypothetical protein